MAHGNDGTQFDSKLAVSSSGIPTSSLKTSSEDSALASCEGVYYLSDTSYGYYYPGCDRVYPEWSEHGYFFGSDGAGMPYAASQPSNDPFVYYMPGYNTYVPGAMMSSDMQYSSNQPYFLHGSETLSSYSHNPSEVAGGSKNSFSGPSSRNGSTSKLRGSTFTNANSMKSDKASISLPDPKPKFSMTTRGISRSVPHFEPLNKFAYHRRPLSRGSNFQNGFSRFPSKENISDANGRFKNTVNKNNEFDLSKGLIHGPRAYGGKTDAGSSAEPSSQSVPVQSDMYNLPDFETEYEHAVFFVIKSFNEDNIYKCIKYSVWSSTPGGNKKLDMAYQSAQVRSNEMGTKCPVFLFFSVNGSGQFVGLAEMTDNVDFRKTMDFWHQDRWIGFFPVRWHVIKDIPNSQLCHIILENNDNKPVTYSRDTQEVHFTRGLEMLDIFKKYAAKSTLLDDFPFYENREKLVLAKKEVGHLEPESKMGPDIVRKSQNSDYKLDCAKNHGKRPEDLHLSAEEVSDSRQTVVDLAKKMSLNSLSSKTNCRSDPATG